MNRNLLIILLFLPGLFASAQVKEKIFVHTDKEFYLAGEIMWYKIYTVDSFSHRPLPLSKVAYIEIVARDQRSVAQARIGLDEGLGNGSFQLPFSIRSGSYVLRAYTNWMKNKGPDCFYEKNITILNTLRDPALIDSLIKAPFDNGSTGTGAPASTQSPDYDIQFFPEGGNLVAGLPTHIAFRIVDRSGKPVSCKGTVLKPTGDPLVHFQTLRFGMGEFLLTPEPNTLYRVSIETDDHQQLTSQLPMPEKQGYTMQVTDAGTDQLRIRVHTNNNDPGLKLLVSSRQKEDKPITNGEAEFTIEKNTLPDGISRLTILTNNNLPVCERLWFKAPTPLAIQAHPDKDSYATREKVNVGLFCTDPSGMPVKLDGSMAVILLDSLQSLTSDDLLSYLFLSSELKGVIIDPGYYFSGHTQEVQATTDLLMLTQGWRKFQYTQSPRIAPEYAGLLVTGKITDKRTGLPVANIPAWICAPGNYFHLAYATSDTNGMIQWDLGLLYGEHELVVQTVQPNKNRYRIDINSSFSETTPRSSFPGLRLPRTATQQLLWRSIGAQTQNAWQRATCPRNRLRRAS